MTIPGFNAVPAVSTGQNQVVAALPMRGAGGGGTCLSNCTDQCSDYASPQACAAKCRTACAGGTTYGVGPGPINQTNCDLCKAGCWAWWFGCDATVGILVGAGSSALLGAAGLAALLGPDWLQVLGIPFSTLTDLADPCGYVKSQCLSGCPC